MWAEKWTIMQEASGSSTAPNAAIDLTHRGLVMPYSDIDLRQYNVAWWHRDISWTNVDFLVRISGIYLGGISQRLSKLPFCTMSLIREI